VEFVALRSLKEEVREQKASERLSAVPKLEVGHPPNQVHARLSRYMRAKSESTFSNANTADFSLKIVWNMESRNINPETVRKNFSDMLNALL